MRRRRLLQGGSRQGPIRSGPRGCPRPPLECSSRSGSSLSSPISHRRCRSSRRRESCSFRPRAGCTPSTRLRARSCGCIPPNCPWGTPRPTPTAGSTWADWIARFMPSTPTPARALDVQCHGRIPHESARGRGTRLCRQPRRVHVRGGGEHRKAGVETSHRGTDPAVGRVPGWVVFFGSQDAYAYALDARTGTQVWRSDKLPGMGWHSWWPVICKDVVLFTRTEVEKGLVGFQNDWLFSKNKTAKNLPGVRGTEPGDWAAGTPTVDIRTNPNGGTIPDWFERYPWRRSLIVLEHARPAKKSPSTWTTMGSRMPPRCCDKLPGMGWHSWWP